MQSGEMVNVLNSYAQEAAGRLGAGYEVSTYVGKTRANARITAVSREAKKDNLENNTLLKAVGALSRK